MEKSQIYIKEAMKMIEKIHGSNHISLIFCMQKLGILDLFGGRYEDALKNLKESKKLIKNLFKYNHQCKGEAY